VSATAFRQVVVAARLGEKSAPTPRIRPPAPVSSRASEEFAKGLQVCRFGEEFSAGDSPGERFENPAGNLTDGTIAERKDPPSW